MSECMVTITKKEYEDLVDKYVWLMCLEAAGVDGWEGYDEAVSLMENQEIVNDE